MRVLQVCSARHLRYGAAQSMLTLSGALKERGHTVEFLTFKGRGAGPMLTELGETIHEVAVRAKVDPIAIAGMARIAKREGFDVIHTHLSTSSINGALAAKVAGIPSVSTVHGLSGKLSFVFSDAMIAVSEQVKSHLVSQGVDPQTVTVVYNGLPPAPIDQDEVSSLKQSLGLEGAFPILGTTSRITELKGIEYAIKAVPGLNSDFPNLAYLIIGEGDDLERCRSLAEAEGVSKQVRFLGYQSPVTPYLALMDIFVLPSLKEALSMSVIEAAQQGVPIVATNVGGLPEVVTDGIGLLVDPYSGDEIGSAVRSIACDDDLRAQMGAKGQARVAATFSSAVMAEQTEKVYLQLTSKR